MGFFEGKKGLILGVANDRSIAWAIAKRIIDEGGECGFSHLPDRPDDEKQRNKGRVVKSLKKLGDNYEPAFLEPLDVQSDDQIAAIMKTTADKFGKIDFLLHSMAFAHPDDLNGDTIETSREGFKMAMDISAYSLIAVCNAAKSIMNEGGSVLCMSYFGGEKIVPGYNVMGVCKAALEASIALHGLRSWPARRPSQRAQCRTGEDDFWCGCGRRKNDEDVRTRRTNGT